MTSTVDFQAASGSIDFGNVTSPASAIPLSSAFPITSTLKLVVNDVNVITDLGVTYAGGGSLASVASNPAKGQYTVAIAGGVATYGFAAADAGATVTATYIATAYGTFQVGNNAVGLTRAPPAGTSIVASFSYAFLCRFDEDQQEFENVMNGLWQIRSLKFSTFR